MLFWANVSLHLDVETEIPKLTQAFQALTRYAPKEYRAVTLQPRRLHHPQMQPL